jgi:predicted GTPase
MPRPPEFWDQVKNVFDPSEVLTGNRGEQFYCEREHNPLQEMIIDFRNPARKSPVRGFLIGHRGAGKSSLLLKFLKEYAAQYLILYFDAQHNLDLS